VGEVALPLVYEQAEARLEVLDPWGGAVVLESLDTEGLQAICNPPTSLDPEPEPGLPPVIGDPARFEPRVFLPLIAR
jgi:hypothetical protein